MRRVMLFAIVATAAIGLHAQSIDLAIVNARVYTGDASRPWAEALAVTGARIAAVGSTAEIRKLSGSSTKVLDLRGAFVSPGFNDAHVHIDSTGALLTGVNLLDVHELKPFVERLAAAAERLPKRSWITRGDWGAYEQWSAGDAGTAPGRTAGGAPFTPELDAVDRVTPEHPVFLNRFDQSLFFANSRALAAAGIGPDTASPPAGEIVKDASGRPTGVLKGTAADLIRKVIPPISFDQRLAQVRAVLKEAREGGVTTMQDLTSGPQLLAYQDLRKRGELTARINLRPTLDNAPHMAALGISRGFGDDWLRYVGYKAWIDGIMGNSGALFFRPYDHDPTNKGYLRHVMFPEGREGAGMTMTEAQRYTDFGEGNLERLLNVAAPTGVPPHVHAIGDKGVRILLDIYEKVLTERRMIDSDHRWRVIHAQVVHPRDFVRFGTLKLVAEVNPYHVSDDMRWMEERIGKERSLGAYAFRKLKDAGAVLVFGSDSPGTNAARYFLNPVYGLYAAVSRQTLKGEPKEGWFPDQRLTIEEAMDAYTRAPAWASFEEGIKGTIAPGKLADLAAFDSNLIEIGKSNPKALLSAKVLYTVVDGKIVYESAFSPSTANRGQP